MNQICITHLSWNCAGCFPVAGGIPSHSQQAGRTQSNIPVANTKPPQTSAPLVSCVSKVPATSVGIMLAAAVPVPSTPSPRAPTRSVSRVPRRAATYIPKVPATAAASVPRLPATAATSIPKVPATAAASVPRLPTTAATSIPKVPATAAASVPRLPATAATSVPRVPATAATSVPRVPATAATSVPRVPATAATSVPRVPATAATSVPRGPTASVPKTPASVSYSLIGPGAATFASSTNFSHGSPAPTYTVYHSTSSAASISYYPPPTVASSTPLNPFVTSALNSLAGITPLLQTVSRTNQTSIAAPAMPVLTTSSTSIPATTIVNTANYAGYPNATSATDDDDPTNAGRSTKRKGLTTTALTKAAKKRLKNAIIDDEVAVEVFHDLKLTAKFLNSGKVLAWALQPDDEAFINIHDYVARSQEHGFGVKILSILRVIVKADNLTAAPLDFNDDPNAQGMYRMMLWHGTKKRALTSILENGLILPTMHGQMFGAGIYFADRVSKSCQYCDITGGCSKAYLFLCDVLLGDMFKSSVALPNTCNAPATYGLGGAEVQHNSVKGVGQNVPDIEWQKEIDGCVWPLGPTVPNQEDPAPLTLRYNEYIVYDTMQVQPKYLVQVQFTRNLVYENLY